MLLAIVGAYAVYDLSTAKPKPVKFTDEATSKTKTDQTEPISESAISNVRSTVQVSFPVSEWRRDPFRRQVERMTSFNLNKVVETILVPKLGNLHLTAISQNGNKSYALINDQILTLGEVMNGFKIVDIQATQVILKKNDFSFTLTLPEEDYNE